MAWKPIALILPLGLDTFAVAAALGMTGLRGPRRRQITLLFTALEAGMPLVGLALGAAADYVAVGVLIAFGLYELLAPENEERIEELASVRGAKWLALGVSISLDELAIGFTLGLLRLPVLLVIVLIAAQTVVVTQLGPRLGNRLSESAEQAVGAALTALGLILLLEKILSSEPDPLSPGLVARVGRRRHPRSAGGMVCGGRSGSLQRTARRAGRGVRGKHARRRGVNLYERLSDSTRTKIPHGTSPKSRQLGRPRPDLRRPAGQSGPDKPDQPPASAPAGPARSLASLQAPHAAGMAETVPDRAVPQRSTDRRLHRRPSGRAHSRSCPRLRICDLLPRARHLGLRRTRARRQLVPTPTRPRIRDLHPRAPRARPPTLATDAAAPRSIAGRHRRLIEPAGQLEKLTAVELPERAAHGAPMGDVHLVPEVSKLKASAGGDLLMHGYGPVAKELARNGLLDEPHLWLHPMLAGIGTTQDTLLADGLNTRLELLDVRRLASGVVLLSYNAAPGANR